MQILGTNAITHLVSVRHSAYFSVLISGLSALLVAPSIFQDFDLHHEGLLLAQALAIHDGSTIHLEVFSSYGPLLPWSQSLFLHLPVSAAVALKVWGLVHIIVVVYFISDLARFAPPSLRSKPWIFWISGLGWAVTADFVQQGNFLPWSSLQGATILVSVLYLTLLSLHLQAGHPRRAIVIGLAGGFLLGTLPFSRINMGIPAALLLMSLAFADRRGLILPLPIYKALGAGGLGSVITILATLFWLGALPSYFEQAVLAPLAWAQDLASSESWVEGNAIFVYMLLPLAIFIASSVTHRVSLVGTTKPAGGYHSDWLRIWLVSISITFISSSFFLLQMADVSTGSVDMWDLLARWVLGNGNILYLQVVIFATLFGVVLLKIWTSPNRNLESPVIRLAVLLGVFSLAGLSQAFPISDSRHIWWGSSTIWLTITISILSVDRVRTKGSRLFAAIIMCHLPLILLGIFENSNDPRLEGPPNSVIAGLDVRPEAWREIEEIRELREAVPEGVKPKIISADGIASVFENRFVGDRPNFVTWAPGFAKDLGPIRDASWVIAQKRGIRQIGFDDEKSFARELEFEIIECREHYCLLKKP